MARIVRSKCVACFFKKASSFSRCRISISLTTFLSNNSSVFSGLSAKELRFFFDFTSQQASDYYDSSVSAMALICALLLTIPFSIGGYFDNTYFTALEAAFALCDGTLPVTLPC
jgi:hypothetical protein